MSALSDLQKQFTRMLPLLFSKAHALGYQITLGDAYRDKRCPYGSEDSNHHRRLAIDLNLFTDDGEYITDGTGHTELHEYWCSIGGAAMIEGDANHYSMLYNGMR